jgi:hypothetical protein
MKMLYPRKMEEVLWHSTTSVEINLGKNAQAANDARDRVPIHFNQLA